MKFIFFLFCHFYMLHTNAQKYILLDKRMSITPLYADTVTGIDEYKNFFAIEKSMLPAFLSTINKLCEMITKWKGGVLDFYLGNSARFHIIKTIFKKNEVRMDVVITSDCISHKFSMHLCDARLSNSFNLFYMKAWVDYIKENTK